MKTSKFQPAMLTALALFLFSATSIATKTKTAAIDALESACPNNAFSACSFANGTVPNKAAKAAVAKARGPDEAANVAVANAAEINEAAELAVANAASAGEVAELEFASAAVGSATTYAPGDAGLAAAQAPASADACA